MALCLFQHKKTWFTQITHFTHFLERNLFFFFDYSLSLCQCQNVWFEKSPKSSTWCRYFIHSEKIYSIIRKGIFSKKNSYCIELSVCYTERQPYLVAISKVTQLVGTRPFWQTNSLRRSTPSQPQVTKRRSPHQRNERHAVGRELSKFKVINKGLDGKKLYVFPSQILLCLFYFLNFKV